jgi:hypothetical protein
MGGHDWLRYFHAAEDLGSTRKSLCHIYLGFCLHGFLFFSLFSSLSFSVLFVFLFFCSAVLAAAISAFTYLFSVALAAKFLREHECS